MGAPVSVADAATLATPQRAGPRFRGHADREVDVIRERQPVDALEHERQREAQLQLDDDRRLIAASRHQVTAAHLGLDLVSLVLQEGLHRCVQVFLALEAHTGESIEATGRG